MANKTGIEWTDLTWNVVHGCSKVSPGCAHCYAETLSHRYKLTTRPWTPTHAAENVQLKPHKLREPLSNAGVWKRPCRVFVNSMSDLFHEEVPDHFIAQVFAVMAKAQQHTFQVLTKRPERMRDLLAGGIFPILLDEAGLALPWGADVPVLPNVWLGVSIENRRFTHRADVLRETPAAVRFISAEPLLGPLMERMSCSSCWDWPRDDCYECEGLHWWWTMESLDLTGIDWLIVGGESGPGHRPMRLEWVRDLRDVAEHTGTALFVKQLGGPRPGTRLEDLPEDLRIREFPTMTDQEDR